MRTARPIEERIERLPFSGCWLWLGHLSSNGYGKLGAQYAHRLVYEKERGKIESGFQIDHLCKVKSCVNPDHLEPVTQQENIRRSEAVSIINGRKTHCPSGHPYNQENTYLDKNNQRYCMVCKRERQSSATYKAVEREHKMKIYHGR